MSRRWAAAVWFVGLGLLVLDRWLKALASSRAGAVGDSSRFIEFGYFPSDATFGWWRLPTGLAVVIALAALLVVSAAVVVGIRQRVAALTLGGAFIAFGGLSNLFDRSILGAVVDYVRVARPFAVVNLADGLILAGAVILLGSVVFCRGKSVGAEFIPRGTKNVASERME